MDINFTLEDINRELAKREYYEYVKYTHSSFYKYTRHGEAACNILNEAIDKRKRMLSGDIPTETQYIRFSMPPQHGKSMHITETFPSYFLGQFQNDGCIEVSYSDTFAEKFGSRNRDKIKEYGYGLFGIQVSKDTNAKGEWEVIDSKGNKTRGGMISRGILSGITGSSLGDCIIIDDPIKNREEANSETYRNKVWDEWTDSISTRIHPGAIVILIMTRWHEDDLWGRMDNKEYGEPLPWKTFNFPLEAEENDYLGRQIGEPLWPEKYGYQFIIERKQHPKTFNSLYQGHPTAEEGNMLKRDWWKYYRLEPQEMAQYMEEIIQSWDASFKESDSTDFVVGQIWGRKKANKYLLDQVRGRMDFPATVQAVKNLSAKWPQSLLKLIEDKANGPAIISTLKRDIPGIVAELPEGSKEARVSAVSPVIESGNVYLPSPEFAPWINDFVEECASFPNGTHDDQVDCMSQALKRLNKYIYTSPKQTELDKLAERYKEQGGKNSAEYQIMREMVDDDQDNKITEGELGL